MSQSIQFENEMPIICFSKTVTGNGTLPHRIVVWDDGRQIIVHTEILHVRIEGQTVIFSHAAYDTGDYFRYDYRDLNDPVTARARALLRATSRFHERAEKL
jgi:hypothetical protein